MSIITSEKYVVKLIKRIRWDYWTEEDNKDIEIKDDKEIIQDIRKKENIFTKGEDKSINIAPIKDNKYNIKTNIPILSYPKKSRIRKLFYKIFPNNIELPIKQPNIKLSFLVNPIDALDKKYGTVVDFESTGFQNNPKSRVITAGFISGRLVEIYQAVFPCMLDEFQNVIKNQMLYRPLPFIAYSTELEQAFSKYGNSKYKHSKQNSYIWKNILQYGETEGYYGWYHYRKKLVAAIRSPRNDYSGRMIPRLWFKWLKTLDINSILEIVYHNVLDVIREKNLFLIKYIYKTNDYLVIVQDLCTLFRKRHQVFPQ
jgi:hypothetical protein